MSNMQYIDELLMRHYEETSEGLVDKPPSRLSRGEGTEKNFYILKIDLVGSTQILLRRQKSTYLKLAHTFLSTVDKITQDLGADPEQTEYAGDSVLAYFPENNSSAEQVMCAASYSRSAVIGLQRLDETLRTLQLRCKVVLHFDTLLVSKIGPRSNSFTTAIGFPLHKVAKLEKEISPDIGRATENFYKKVSRDNKKYLHTVYEEKQVLIPTEPMQDFNHIVSTSLGIFNSQLSAPNNAQNTLSSLLNQTRPPIHRPIPAPQYRTEKTVIGYNLKWALLFHDLGLNKI